VTRKGKKRSRTTDVVIVGGGIMGCASAWLLARRGLDVTVLERSVPGAEASSAAAGILGVSAEGHAPGAMSALAQKSGRLYPAFCADLGRATGIDVEYRKCGVLRVTFDRREPSPSPFRGDSCSSSSPSSAASSAAAFATRATGASIHAACCARCTSLRRAQASCFRAARTCAEC
jgi:glycine/D-amino acid oxidase-like deaminating enzyme